MLKSQADVRVGSISVPGRVRLANEDAYRCAPALGLFVVADGLGGLPSGEVASHTAAYALPRLLERALNHPAIAGKAPLGALLRDAVILLNRHLYQQSLATAALDGMATTLVSMIFDGRFAHIVHAGDSRAYFIRGGRIAQLTKDHSRKTSDRPGAQGLLTEYLVMPGDVDPAIGTYAVQPGDRLLLCTDGLSGPVRPELLQRLASLPDDPQDVCQRLADAANEAGGPDNITAILVEWRGFREGRFPVPVMGRTQGLDIQHGEQLRSALEDLERDLAWLLAGAREVAQPSPLRSLAAAKRLLGPPVYLDYVLRHPSDNPMHVFHQACTDAGGAWRRSYEAHLGSFLPLLRRVLEGQVRMSPLLSDDDVGYIFSSLWRDWRRVEERYFTICSRPALNQQERSLDPLIEHMTSSVRTMAGLSEMLPRMAINLAE